MTIDPTSSASASLPTNQGSNTQPKLATSKEPDKVTKVFKEALTPEEKEAKWKSEREFYVKYVMETKDVSRDVAESEVDFFF